MSSIRTPDQRVRVFISSTINELADERAAARDAINKLRLIPVFFEAGARPHPPRDLYRAYLEQSHIFVGIYWNKYGWVAPGMDVSGLEDEYRLSAGKPRLIYVKKTDKERELRLKQLLTDIEKSETASYQFFSTPKELTELLAGDLSLLLSEHFQTTEQTVQPVVAKRAPLPVIHGKLVGRKEEVKSVKEMLLRPDVALVTLTGTGGTGKTRLSIHVASQLQNQFRDGVFYIQLAAISEPESLIPAIVHQLGLFDSGKQPLRETLMNYLRDKQALLVLDNFEQIVTAAMELSDVLAQCAHIKILVTSRTPLHIRAENVYALQPLAIPDILQSKDLLASPSVELFILRGKEVNPALPVDDENVNAIAQICRKLDGLPLAIELAAARSKLLAPGALLKRMENVLDTLTHGARDLPERQRTLRATIAWSHNLLDTTSKSIFRRLSVFKGGWTLDAADAVANWENADVLDVMDKLCDLGMIQSDQTNAETVFSLFETIREFAIEQLNMSDDSGRLRQMHLEYYIRLSEEAEHYSWTPQRLLWYKHFDGVYQNIREAFYYSIGRGDHQNAWKIVHMLGYYWMMTGKYSEALQWIGEAQVSADLTLSGDTRTKVDKQTQAGALRTSGMVHYFTSSFKRSVQDMKESISLFTEVHDELNAGRAMSYYGIAAVSIGDFEASSYFQQALELGKKHNDPFTIVVASTFVSEVYMTLGDYESAARLIEYALEVCRANDDKVMLTVTLGQQGNLQIVRGEYALAEQSYNESIELEKYAPIGIMVGWFYIGFAFCKIMRGETLDVRKNLTRGLAFGQQGGDKAIVLSALLAFASLAVISKDAVRAARLMGSAERMMLHSGYVLWNATKKMYKWVAQQLEQSGDQKLREQAMKEGSAFSEEQAVKYALET